MNLDSVTDVVDYRMKTVYHPLVAPGKGERKRGAAAWIVAGPDSPAVRGDDRVSQVQPQARPLGVVRQGVVDAVEPLEDAFELVGGTPVPWSLTATCTCFKSYVPRTTMCPPFGEYLMALLSRLSITCRSRA